MVGECHQHGRLGVQRKHRKQRSNGSAVGQQFALLQLHGQAVRGCGCGGVRTMGVSRTGRFTRAANTPRAIEMDHTMV